MRDVLFVVKNQVGLNWWFAWVNINQKYRFYTNYWEAFQELQEFNWTPYGRTCDEFLAKVIPRLQETGAEPYDVRIIYFFDN